MKNLCLLLVLFCFLSCSKEKGFIPDPDPYEAYYSDKKADLLWSKYCKKDGNDIQAFEVIDDKVILSTYNYMQIFNTEKGQLIHNINLEGLMPSSQFYDFEVRTRGNTMYVIDKVKAQVLLLNAETGHIVDARSPLSGFTEFHQSFGINIVKDHIYFMKYNDFQKYSFYRYNYVDDKGEEVTLFSDLNIDFSPNQKVIYDPKTELFYALLNTESRGHFIFSIDKNTGAHEELWNVFRDPDNWKATNELVLMEDILIFELDGESIFGFNVKKKSIEWINESDQVEYITDAFKHNERMYLNIRGELHEINHLTGEFIWTNRFFCEGSVFDLVPNSSLAVSAVKDVDLNNESYWTYNAIITDLIEGKRLVEWEVKHPPGEDIWFKDIQYHERNETKSVYVASLSHLFKYEWPLEK